MCPLRRSQKSWYLGSDLVSAARYQSGETSNKDQQQTLATPRVGVEVLCSRGLDPMLQSPPKRQQRANRSAAILVHCSPPCGGFRSVGREHGKSYPMESLDGEIREAARDFGVAGTLLLLWDGFHGLPIIAYLQLLEMTLGDAIRVQCVQCQLPPACHPGLLQNEPYDMPNKIASSSKNQMQNKKTTHVQPEINL